MKNNEQLIKIGNLVQSKILKHELIILLVIISLIAAKLFVVTFPDNILFSIFSLIAIVYFFSAFTMPVEKMITGMDLFIHKLIGIASAITLMGILFGILNLEGNNEMVYVGLTTLIITFVFIIIYRIKNTGAGIFSNLLMLRIVVLALISGGLFYFGMG
ncbi:MAG: hypothetical protein GQ527_04700 [Bacteroidales bacterium]|nr:hypothetical protein [Bacteroidales bacterium]